MTEQGVIGTEKGLPWHLPADLRHFRALTWGKPIVMGRKTYQILGKPLSGRLNWVLSGQRTLFFPGCEIFHDVTAVIEQSKSYPEVMIIGGAEIYRQFMPFIQRFYLTLIAANIPGDIYFPEIDWQQWQEIERESYQPDAQNPYPYHFITLERKQFQS